MFPGLGGLAAVFFELNLNSKLWFAVVLFGLWCYCSQKVLHLAMSMLTFYSSGMLSQVCFQMWSLIVFGLGASVAWWDWRTEGYRGEVVDMLRKEGGGSAGGGGGISDILESLRSYEERVVGGGEGIYRRGRLLPYLSLGEDMYSQNSGTTTNCLLPRPLLDCVLEMILYGSILVFFYNFVLLYLLRIKKVDHVDQIDGDGIPFSEVEGLTGFNYENTNPILVLKSHFQPHETKRLCRQRTGGAPLIPFAPGKQYLLHGYCERWKRRQAHGGNVIEKMGGIFAMGARAERLLMAGRPKELMEQMI